MREIAEPTVRALEADCLPYVGFLYAGLMIGADGAPRRQRPPAPQRLVNVVQPLRQDRGGSQKARVGGRRPRDLVP